jgi:hypothetical protein
MGAILDPFTAKDQTRADGTSGREITPESEFERMLRERNQGQYGDMNKFLQAGIDPNAMSNAAGTDRGLADMLRQYSQTGGQPNTQDWNNANEFASQAFAPQQLQMNYDFDQQNIQAKQMAAKMGRSANDPQIQAQLAQQQSQMAGQLNQAQSQYASNFALAQPRQRLGYTSQLADVNRSRASMAMQNQQTMLGMSSQNLGMERDWRLQTGGRFGSQVQESGGGLKGALTGFMGVASTALGGYSAFSGGGKPQQQQGYGPMAGGPMDNMGPPGYGPTRGTMYG